MITFFKKNKISIPKQVIINWSMNRLDANLLQWVGNYRSKAEYEYENEKPYDKEEFINENLKELEKIYIARKDDPNIDMYKKGGAALVKERKYTSEQDWEQKYKPYRKSKVLSYKHHKNTQQTVNKYSWEYTIGGL
jgi:hypothetical protein